MAVVVCGPLGDQSFCAPEIHERCGGRSSNRLVKQVERLLGARAVRCPICNCPLEKKFGEKNWWHFAKTVEPLPNSVRAAQRERLGLLVGQLSWT